MTEENNRLPIDIVPQADASGADQDKPFTEELFQPIAEKYGLAPEAVFVARLQLNLACNLPDPPPRSPEVTTKLAQIHKLSSALQTELANLDDDVVEELNAIGEAQRLMQALDTFPGSDEDGAGRFIRTVIAPGEASYREAGPLTQSVLQGLAGLNELLLSAEAEAKTGRPEDDQLDLLFEAAFQVFENFCDRKFTLDWHQGRPVSLAAQYCVDVAAIAAPHATASSVRTAARKVRERSFKVHNLRKASVYVENLRKQKR